MAFSVSFMGERLSGLTTVGFSMTLLGVSLYKLVPKGPPAGSAHDDSGEAHGMVCVRGDNPSVPSSGVGYEVSPWSRPCFVQRLAPCDTLSPLRWSTVSGLSRFGLSVEGVVELARGVLAILSPHGPKPSPFLLIARSVRVTAP